jgi:hypothetical protein
VPCVPSARRSSAGRTLTPCQTHALQRDTEQEVESYLRRRFESLIQSVDVLEKEDLSLVRAARPGSAVALGRTI